METGYSPVEEKYIAIINKAIEKKNEKTLSSLEEEFSNNQEDNQILRKLIEVRKSIGITNNAELIEKYVSKLPIDELQKYETVLFILEAGPYADGNAFKIAFSNNNIISTIYHNIPGNTFSKIRSAITDNTMINAIKTKNINKAIAVGNYLKELAGPKYGPENYKSTMLSYYRGIGDTTNFLKNAFSYYDENYMTLSLENLQKKQENYLHSEILKSLPYANTTLVRSQKDSIEFKALNIKNKTVSTSSIPIEYSNLYSNILNNAAWDVYITGTGNINYLQKAMSWSIRSIELHQSANYYDTLAHILYKLSYIEEAIKMQELAIAQAKKQNIPVEKMLNELKKIKNRTL